MNEIVIYSAAFLTSIISGAMGMGGGMVLMALLSLLLPVKDAMILHGICQLVSNGSRFFLLREHLCKKILLPYFAGTAIIFASFSLISITPSKSTIFFLIGGLTLVGLIPRLGTFFDIDRKWRAVFCGIIVTSAQFLAGASGGVLDMFYLNSKLTRTQIVATKAFTQSLGHMTKVIYFSFILGGELSSEFIYLSLAPLATILGTKIGKDILLAWNDQQFKFWGKKLTLLIATLSIYKGISLAIFS